MSVVNPRSYTVNLDGSGCGQQNDEGLLPPGFQYPLVMPSDVDSVPWPEPVELRKDTRLIKGS